MTDSGTNAEMGNGTSRPTPDPTFLTTQALDREAGHLRDLVDQRLVAVERERDDARHNSAERAAMLNREREEQMAALRDIVEGRITALNDRVEQKFAMLEGQRAEQKQDTKQAVDAALSAAKEAVKEQTTASERSIDKSEKATAETIRTNQELNRSTTDALTKSLDEVKIAVSRTDAAKLGAKEDRSGLYTALGIVMTMIFLVIAVVGMIATRTT